MLNWSCHANKTKLDSDENSGCLRKMDERIRDQKGLPRLNEVTKDWFETKYRQPLTPIFVFLPVVKERYSDLFILLKTDQYVTLSKSFGKNILSLFLKL